MARSVHGLRDDSSSEEGRNASTQYLLNTILAGGWFSAVQTVWPWQEELFFMQPAKSSKLKEDGIKLP